MRQIRDTRTRGYTSRSGFVVTYRRVVGAKNGERQVSIECARCGREVAYSGNGRRPKFCSPTCRSRAWELRRAATELKQPDPMPAIVREVVERTVDRDRPVPAPVAPRTVADWVPLLEQLTRAVRDDPRSLVRSKDDWQELALTVRELHNSFSWRDELAPDTRDDVGASPRLSRQQRRALERQQRDR